MARGKFDWGRTCEILALLYTINSKEGAKPVQGCDLNPFLRRKSNNVIKGKLAWDILKAITKKEKK